MLAVRNLDTWKTATAVAVLLALHVVLGTAAAMRQSVTVDEIFHVTGGYFFDRFGDYRLHTDNGVLPQRLHALPAVLAGAKPPPLEGSEYWRAADLQVVSYQFFYESGNDHWPLLLRARLVNMIFSVGIGLLVFVWARRLAGDLAGLIALVLSAFSPTLLAHGPLATTDAAAAFFLLASAGAFWVQLRDGGWISIALSAVVFGLACVSKYSAVLLLPVYGLLALVHLLSAAAAERKTGRVAVSFAVHGAVAWIVIWMCFGFRYGIVAPGLPPADGFAAKWDWMLGHAGWQGVVIRQLCAHRVFPEGFLFGYTNTYLGSLSRGAFLAGEFSNTGWRSFFPLAFLWKSTPAELAGAAIVAVAAGLHWRRLQPWIVRLAPLLALAGIYGAVALASHLNIGHRHLLPLYPVLFVMTGVALARANVSPQLRLAFAGLAAGSQLFVATVTFPHYLAYFNAFAGGPSNGWRLLVDSSLDWGQDLPDLHTWLEKNNSGPNASPVYLSYFGSGEPGYYHISARRLPFVNGFKFAQPYVRLEPGVYCISATTLQQVYSVFRGPWTPAFETEYQRLRALEPLFDAYARDPQRRAELERDAPADQWRRTWTQYDLLRFARLCHYLRLRPPDANAGYSILIYRLDAREIRGATGSFADWQTLNENARASRP